MKGIVLAGGTGSRLWPITRSISKQLLPVYDKPMIYYPLSTLMLAGIREVLIIVTPRDLTSFKQVLGDGSRFGIEIEYAIQEEPRGLVEAFIIGEKFIGDNSVLLILGDNIFHGVGLGANLRSHLPQSGSHIFTYLVSNPSDYGVIYLNDQGFPIGLKEKPTDAKSNLAITGLYFFGEGVSGVAKSISPSARGELEITDLLLKYLEVGSLTYTQLSRGTAWLDTGTANGMHDASTYVRVIEERTGLKIGCLEEIALNMGLISPHFLENLLSPGNRNSYDDYVFRILREKAVEG
jgi:glucose-1-phosphate thymidylyltransferase